MFKTPRFSALISLALALSASAGFAQAPVSPVAVRSSRAEGVSVAPGGVVTTPFTIRNTTSDSVVTTQEITLPSGWRTVNSLAPSVIGANAMELWLVSVAAPAGAPAGTYVLRAGIRANGALATDSVIVTIDERYALDIKPVNPPTFVLAGDMYDVSFIVRNAGNVASRVTLKATSNRGSKPTLTSSLIDLTPGATKTITATVKVPGGLLKSQQDLLEVIAIDASRDSVRASTSVETTIIARTGDGADFWTVPTEVSVRAAAPGSGVSPIVATGSGRLSQKGDATVDFWIHTAPDAQSTFGERDEYRFGLHTKDASVRVGDNSYGFSTLTAAGNQGTGAEVLGNRGGMTGGFYMQRNRWTPRSASEFAATLGSADDKINGGSLIVLQRGPAHVVGTTARALVYGANVELEGAASDSLSHGGKAGTLRLFGQTKKFSYDFGAQTASDLFAGAQRASSDKHLTLSGAKVGNVFLSAMAATHAANPTSVSNGFGQTLSTGTLSASFMNGSAIEYDRFARDDRGTQTGLRGVQNSLRARGRFVLGSFDLLTTLQHGLVAQRDSAGHAFTTVSGSVRARLAHEQFVSAFMDVTDGKALGATGRGTITGGSSAELKFGALTAVRVTTSMTAQRNDLSAWIGQADFTVERHVRQSIVALRGRMSQSGAKSAPGTNAFYIEVRTPLNLPTARLDVGGRARAQVVDAETGKGVAGALVRMGDLAAVTDKDGVANFKGLKTGDYHAVVEGGITAGQLVNGGNVNVTGSRPAMFTMNVARGARVLASVRRFEKNSNAAPNGADSVLDIGGVGQATLALISSRDTIWQTADDRGRVDFGSVAPGQYTVKVVGGELPEFTVFEKKQVDINVTAGENRQVELRLMPQTRAVEFVGGETLLVAAPAPAPTVVAAPAKPAPRAAPKSQNQDGQKNQQNQND